MRRTALSCLSVALWLAVAPAWAGEPRAVLVAPERLPAGSMVFLDLSGSSFDADAEGPLLELETIASPGTAPRPAVVLYDHAGRPVYGLLPPGEPGLYRFGLHAGGTVEGRSRVVWRHAYADVAVGESPAPTPTPDPTPPPVPGPTPPDRVTGKLWLSYVVPPAATPPEAALRTDAALRKALDGLDAEWRTYRSDEADIARLGLSRYVEAGLPRVIVQDEEGKVIRSIEKPDAEAVLVVVKGLRGVEP